MYVPFYWLSTFTNKNIYQVLDNKGCLKFPEKVLANTILTESSPELSHGGHILRTLS